MRAPTTSKSSPKNLPDASVVVRTARLEDVPEIVRSYVAVADELSWVMSEPPVDEAAIRLRFSTWIESDTAFLLVAEADGEHVGHIAVQGITESKPPSFGMNVDAECRGRGVGSALLAEAIARTREAGAWKLCLEVFAHNEGAIALYRKLGFEEEGRLRGHYRRANGDLWDAVLMGLRLDA